MKTDSKYIVINPRKPCIAWQTDPGVIYNYHMDRYRIIEGIPVYFVTFTVIDWLPVFVEEKAISILVDSLKYCIEQKNLRVNAYVIMPNHFHAIVFDAQFDSDRLSRTLTDLRKFTGKQLCNFIDARYSKVIAGILRTEDLIDRDRRFWQSGWHAEGIDSDRFLEQKVNYIHENPCRKGLVRVPEDWRYSSAAFWFDGTEVDVSISEIAWEE